MSDLLGLVYPQMHLNVNIYLSLRACPAFLTIVNIYPYVSYTVHIYLYIVTIVNKNIYNIGYTMSMSVVLNCFSSGFWLDVWT